MVLYKGKKTCFILFFLISFPKLSIINSFIFVLPVATHWPCIPEKCMSLYQGLFPDITEFNTFYMELRFFIPGTHSFFVFFLNFYLLFIYYVYFWLCWVFVSVWGLSPVAASGGHSSSRCAGLSLSWPLLLRSRDSRRSGSVVVAHGPSCSAACGIFPDQGLNPHPLHWQADSQPLRHQGSPPLLF